MMDEAVPGWATMTILIAIFGSLNLMGLGIIGEYLGRMFEETRNRPLYWLSDDTAAHLDNPYRVSHKKSERGLLTRDWELVARIRARIRRQTSDVLRASPLCILCGA